jgi:hypothetical protein
MVGLQIPGLHPWRVLHSPKKKAEGDGPTLYQLTAAIDGVFHAAMQAENLYPNNTLASCRSPNATEEAEPSPPLALDLELLAAFAAASLHQSLGSERSHVNQDHFLSSGLPPA